MRGGGSWKGQPEVVGAWLPESPPLPHPARFVLEKGAR